MRSLPTVLGLSAVLATWIAAPIRAEEIVYLTSGQAMPVRAHEFRGDMIHLDLGGDAFIAFPASMVEKIENAGKGVVLTQSFNGANNVMKPGPPNPGGDHPMTGRSSIRVVDSKAGAGVPDPHVGTDSKMGISVYRPDPFGSPAKRSHVVAGRRDMMGRLTPDGEGYRGTSRMGNKYVIGDPASQGRAQTVGILPLKGTAPPPPPPEPPADAPEPGGTPDSGGGEQPGD